ncbi:ribosomal protein S6 kinase alpha-5-like [Thrips palmi]|uniref:non-specific serine/threonine protein kinase n=1 Tax=Thrips palmi TaxID=161013 RepID=A0A6P8YJ92_THRPL|nr:ribosomal protein S6 kinase alpha-5-like [Thrips palmi]
MGVHKTVEHESGYFEDENSDDDAVVHGGGVCGLGHLGRRANPAATPTSTMSTCDALNNNVAPGQDCCHAIRPAIDRVNFSSAHRVDMSSFELLKVLGTGAYGKVFLVRKKGGADDGRLYAMKVLKKATIVQKKKTTEHTRTERQVLEAVRQSPFLVTLHYAFQTDAKLHLILDYVSGGELFTHLYQREHFTEDQVRIYIGEIILALEHLHKLGIIYRDIKLENILLDSDGHVVLTDFGLSKEFLPHEKDQRAYSFCGTIEYMAPEVVRGGSTGHDIAVDWWSVGVLTYELLTGASPFTVEGENNTQTEISRRILKTNPPIPDGLSFEVKDLIAKLLVKDPRKRLGGGEHDALELKKHPFFRSLDWVALSEKRVPAPFVPRIAGELDVSNFSEEFTRMTPTDSPAVIPPNFDKIFKGYSYVAPSVLFSENVVSDDIFNQTKRPSPTSLTLPCIKDSPFFQQYEIDFREGILGDGTYSVCRKCRHRETGQEFAVKIVSRKTDCTREINLLRACQGHSNIVRLYEVFYDEAHTYLVLELLRGGELLERIRRQARFTESQASRIMCSLVAAVNEMHSRGVVHRDLKPENLLFTDTSENSDIKIVDFGFARLKQEKEVLTTPCFTLHYAAPEVLKQAFGNSASNNSTSATCDNKGTPVSQPCSEGYDENCDLWSLGVILYTMLSGRAPFHARSRDHSAASIMSKIKEGDFNFNADAWQNVSSAAKQLTKGLLTVDPKKRLRMSDLRTNEWIQGSERAGFATVPLMTPDVLTTGSSARSAEINVAQIFSAFHQAHREGFRLQDVVNAKLAQRRRNKKSSLDNRSFSTSSTFSSSSSSGTSSIQTPVKVASSTESPASLSASAPSTAKSHASLSQSHARPRADQGDNVFNFGESRVREYLSSLSTSLSSSSSDRDQSLSMDCCSLAASPPSLPATLAQAETPVLSPVPPRKKKGRLADPEPQPQATDSGIPAATASAPAPAPVAASKAELATPEVVTLGDADERLCAHSGEVEEVAAEATVCHGHRSRTRKGKERPPAPAQAEAEAPGRTKRRDASSGASSSATSAASAVSDSARQGPLTRSLKRKLAESGASSASTSEEEPVPRKRTARTNTHSHSQRRAQAGQAAQAKGSKGGRQRQKRERIATIDLD